MQNFQWKWSFAQRNIWDTVFLYWDNILVHDFDDEFSIILDLGPLFPLFGYLIWKFIEYIYVSWKSLGFGVSENRSSEKKLTKYYKVFWLLIMLLCYMQNNMGTNYWDNCE